MTYLPLRSGEFPVDHAPLVQTKSGNQCIPQHYLEFKHTRETIEDVVSLVSYSARFPIFVSEDEGELFIQIGVIGPDNYKKRHIEKIVFGRRWRVEPHLPTSEIIQTVFLALQKAQEHEIREQFSLTHQGHLTTPFNCHQDLPLMAHLSKDHVSSTTESTKPDCISDAIRSVRFNGVRFEVTETLRLKSGAFAITLASMTRCEEYISTYGHHINFISESLSPGIVLHNLMKGLIRLSDRKVEEIFQFDGFSRFSHDVDPYEVAEMSARYRSCPSKFINFESQAPKLLKAVKSMNYDIDQKRIPVLSDGPYAQRIKSDIAEFGIQID